MAADGDHRHDRCGIGNRGEQSNRQRVSDAGLFDDRRQPEAHDVDAARNAEIRRGQQPYARGDESVFKFRQSLLLLLFAGDDPRDGLLFVGIEPFGFLDAIVEIE